MPSFMLSVNDFPTACIGGDTTSLIPDAISGYALENNIPRTIPTDKATIQLILLSWSLAGLFATDNFYVTNLNNARNLRIIPTIFLKSILVHLYFQLHRYGPSPSCLYLLMHIECFRTGNMVHQLEVLALIIDPDQNLFLYHI